MLQSQHCFEESSQLHPIRTAVLDDVVVSLRDHKIDPTLYTTIIYSFTAKRTATTPEDMWVRAGEAASRFKNLCESQQDQLAEICEALGSPFADILQHCGATTDIHGDLVLEQHAEEYRLRLTCYQGKSYNKESWLAIMDIMERFIKQSAGCCLERGKDLYTGSLGEELRCIFSATGIDTSCLIEFQDAQHHSISLPLMR